MDLYLSYSLAIYLGPVVALLMIYDPYKVNLGLDIIGDRDLIKMRPYLPLIWAIFALSWPIVSALKIIGSCLGRKKVL